jgi:hypothetical protein
MEFNQTPFFGAKTLWLLTTDSGKSVNHKGHEGTQRKFASAMAT